MNRLLAGSVFALTLVGADVASAATMTTTPSPQQVVHPATVKIDYSPRCKTLGE